MASIITKKSTFKLRVAPEDLKLWRTAARAERTFLSEWIRRACGERVATAKGRK